jgi:pyruvate-formate lyase-activating enzyme
MSAVFTASATARRRHSGKFRDPLRTASGEARARVALGSLDTLWFNTGTLCNLTCGHCYIESSPRNDRLVYLSAAEVAPYLDEIAALRLGTGLIGFTGGEPFMNPHLAGILELTLKSGFRVLVLTNAMKPMHRMKPALLRLRERFADRLQLRVSLDHYGPAVHEAERGPRSWRPTTDGLSWLARHGFAVSVATRLISGESEAEIRRGFAGLFAELRLAIDANDPIALTVFPELDETAEMPEITEACWGILGKSPDDVMCASSRMVVKFRGAARPTVIACTLLPYDERFDLGPSLAGALGSVPLNHPHCAKFCVLGGGACSRG